MEYTSTTKEISRTYANIKYWAVANARARCAELAYKLKKSIARLREMLDTVIRVSACVFEKSEAIKIRKEIDAIRISI